MRHARNPLWSQLITLPDVPALPLQARLRAALVHEIVAGRLAAGASLPSSRDLAAMLKVSRNTVTAAVQQLVDEGFLVARSRSGVFVAEGVAQRSALPASAPAGAEATPPDWRERLLRTPDERPTLAKPEGWRDAPFPFVYGLHDPQLFPTDEFRECCARSLARAQLANWTPDLETGDLPELVEQLRTRVLPRRGVFALADEIVVTVGAQQAFQLLADALFDGAARIGFEDPGYPHARNAFALREPVLLPLRVDDDGVQVDAAWPALDYAFVTPSNQCPTTATLPLARRERLLQRAQAEDFVVIEDDYEAENLTRGAPMPALKSLDRSGRVIYVGSLPKSLAPALRLGYIVAPRALVAQLRRLRHVTVRHPSAFLQQAYALFLALGHHESHNRRVNQALQERVALAAEGLRRHLPGFEFRLPQGGASVWVGAPAWVDAAELAEAARRQGVLIEPGDVFHLEPPYPCPNFRLRLSSIAPGRIDAGLRALARAVAELARARGQR